MIRWIIRFLIGFRGMTRDEARDWAAILYTPVLTVCAVGQVLGFMFLAWPDSTAAQRINYLGWSLIINLGLIGLGTFFLQRRTVNVHAKTAAGEVEITNVTAKDEG